jgi:hypothetical protein
MTSSAAAETVELPWVDEPVELAEAVEMIARADEADEDVIEAVTDRVERLERRVAGLEDGTGVECPNCGGTDDVYKAGIGAARLASQGALDDENARALNGESHVCLECRKSFTPTGR